MGKNRRKLIEHRIEHDCPVCAAHMELMASIFGRRDKPTPGTFLLCIRCGELGMLCEKNETRRPTPEELFELMMSDRWRRVEMAQAFVKQRTGLREISLRVGDP